MRNPIGIKSNKIRTEPISICDKFLMLQFFPHLSYEIDFVFKRFKNWKTPLTTLGINYDKTYCL